MMNKVYVTGLGVVSSLGKDVDQFWSAMLQAESAPQNNEALPQQSMPIRHTYAINIDANHDDGALPFGGTAARYAVSAAQSALRDANIPVDEHKHIGVCLGSAMGDDVFEKSRLDSAMNKNDSDKHTFTNSGFLFDASAAVAHVLNLSGPNVCATTACSAGLYSISLAADMIRHGQADAMLVGGSESVSRVAMGCFNRLSAIDPIACRPFDVDRKGTVMGEGAAILLIESERSMKQRGHSHSYAEICGEGWSCDSHHATIPEPSGKYAITAARSALGLSTLKADKVDCVLVHGTGTQQNDEMESTMIKTLFSSADNTPWVSGVKGKLGHQGGAAGAFQALTACLILKHGKVPPTGGTQHIDPQCPVKLAKQGGSVADVQHIIMNSYAFGGNNISMVMRKGDVSWT